MQADSTDPTPMDDVPNSKLELLKLKLDYAWKWFSFHADQRTKMFNFMLIVVGIFATGVVSAVKEGMPRIAFWLCVAPGVLAFVFAALDRRNRDLVWLGEDVLRELERKDLFGEREEIADGAGASVPFGILWRQTRSEEIWRSRSAVVRALRDARLGKHRVWLRLIALLIGIFFFLGAWFIWRNQTEIAERNASSSVQGGHHYGAIIDAGSSGSRLAIFEWRIAEDRTPHVWPVVSAEDEALDDTGKCPLTSLPNQQNTCNCLIKLAKSAREDAKGFLGEPNLPPIPLWVKATAGVRRQSTESQDRILNATNACLANVAGYEWKGAEVISGEKEGLYAWLAVNQLAGTLRPGHVQESHGIVEMGGQSAQVAYRIPAPPALAPARGQILDLRLGPAALHIYAFSDDLGSAAANKDVKERAANACALGADPKKCVNAINRFIKKVLCPQPSGENCPAMQLHPPSRMPFAGLSNFKHVVQNMGLGADATLKVVRERAFTICGPGNERLRYTKLVRAYVLVPAGNYVEGVCFNALYATQLAEYGWGLSLDDVRSPDPRWPGNPSWPLGAMIFEAASGTSAARWN